MDKLKTAIRDTYFIIVKAAILFLTVENVDYIFLQYYFDENEHKVDINAPHCHGKRLENLYRRTKEFFKDAVNQSDKASRKVVQDLFLEHGGFQNVQSSLFLMIKVYRRGRDHIVEISDICQNKVKNNKSIRNVLIAPDKVISLMTDRQLSDIARICAKPHAISILVIDPKHNLGPCYKRTDVFYFTRRWWSASDAWT